MIDLVRRRVVQALILVALLALAPAVMRELWPSAADFVPPSLLLLLVALTTFLAVAAWRTEWVVRALFSDPLPPERLAKLRSALHRQRISTAIGLVVTGVLTAAWIKSLL